MEYKLELVCFEWCHFQWPWTTHNPDFKDTRLLDVEYPRNGTR